jgi:hypothetical protein
MISLLLIKHLFHRRYAKNAKKLFNAKKINLLCVFAVSLILNGRTRTYSPLLRQALQMPYM